jgi:hypothetical protein
LVIEGKATLRDMETSWSLLDMADANDVLDSIASAEAEWHKRNKPK